MNNSACAMPEQTSAHPTVVAVDRSLAALLELGELLRAVLVKGLRLGDATLLDDPHLLCDARDKVLVVRDEHHAAVELLDAIGQGDDALEVEVIRRLVEYEDVRLGVRHGGERDARALPARERRRGQRHHLGGHAASGQMRSQILLVAV